MREPPGGPGTHRCRAERVTSRNGCSSATAALFTSSWNGPAAPTAASTASQSARSRQRVSMPGHYGEGGRRGREAAREPGGRCGVIGAWEGGRRRGSGTSRVRLSKSAAVRLSAVTRAPALLSATATARPIPAGTRRQTHPGPTPGPGPPSRPPSPLPAPVTRARRPRKLRCGSMFRWTMAGAGAGSGADR